MAGRKGCILRKTTTLHAHAHLALEPLEDGSWPGTCTPVRMRATARSDQCLRSLSDVTKGLRRSSHSTQGSVEREHHFLKPAQLYPYTYNILRVFQTNKSYFKVSRLDKTYSRKYTATDSRQYTTRNLGNMHELCAKGNTGDS
jgi:hypothetical protein